jgi:hypothetical protein
MAWIPSPDILFPLYGLYETEPIEEVFTYSPVDLEPNVTHYTVEWLGRVPENATLVGGPVNVTLSAPNLYGVVPIEVHYQHNRVPGVTTYWSDLPADAEQIILYVAPGQTQATTTFAVYAYNNEFLISTTVYTILVLMTYNTGRDRLIAEVNARA